MSGWAASTASKLAPFGPVRIAPGRGPFATPFRPPGSPQAPFRPSGHLSLLLSLFTFIYFILFSLPCRVAPIKYRTRRSVVDMFCRVVTQPRLPGKLFASLSLGSVKLTSLSTSRRDSEVRPVTHIFFSDYEAVLGPHFFFTPTPKDSFVEGACWSDWTPTYVHPILALPGHQSSDCACPFRRLHRRCLFRCCLQSHKPTELGPAPIELFPSPFECNSAASHPFIRSLVLYIQALPYCSLSPHFPIFHTLDRIEHGPSPPRKVPPPIPPLFYRSWYRILPPLAQESDAA